MYTYTCQTLLNKVRASKRGEGDDNYALMKVGLAYRTIPYRELSAGARFRALSDLSLHDEGLFLKNTAVRGRDWCKTLDVSVLTSDVTIRSVLSTGVSRAQETPTPPRITIGP